MAQLRLLPHAASTVVAARSFRDTGELPEDWRGGLLQCFYCVHGEDESGDDCPSVAMGWKAFSKGKLVRIVVPRGRGEARPIPIEKGYFPARTIVGWRRFTDYPAPVEFKRLGLRFTWNSAMSGIDVQCDQPKLHLRGISWEIENSLCDACPGDKLAGWPKWVQGVEYPKCKRCGSRMRYLFQIDSKDHVPYTFGDMGCGHITQCPNHPEVLTFSWAGH